MYCEYGRLVERHRRRQCVIMVVILQHQQTQLLRDALLVHFRSSCHKEMRALSRVSETSLLLFLFWLLLPLLLLLPSFSIVAVSCINDGR